MSGNIWACSWICLSFLSLSSVSATSLTWPYDHVTPGEGTAQVDYFDQTSSQLMGNLIADAEWISDLGTGDAVTEPSGLEVIHVGFNQRSGVPGLYVSPALQMAGASFALLGSEVGSLVRGSVVFSLNIRGNSQDLALNLKENVRWTFASQFQDFGVAITQIPEPCTASLTCAALAGGWFLRRRTPGLLPVLIHH